MMTAAKVGSIPCSRIALGGAGWSINDGGDDELSIATIHAAIDAGITLIDTARAYSRPDFDGHSESLIRRALSGRADADSVLVATKGGHRREGHEFLWDARPEQLRLDVEHSLAMLGVERLGLYFLHWPDPKVPIEESMGALEELRLSGAILQLGVSNFDSQQLARAESVARISAVENRLSLTSPTSLSLLQRSDLAFLAYSPLGGGGIAALVSAVPVVGSIAAKRGVMPAAIALAWVLAKSPNTIAIVGARRPRTICDSSQLVSLTDAELGELNFAHDEIARRTTSLVVS